MATELNITQHAVLTRLGRAFLNVSPGQSADEQLAAVARELGVGKSFEDTLSRLVSDYAITQARAQAAVQLQTYPAAIKGQICYLPTTIITMDIAAMYTRLYYLHTADVSTVCSHMNTTLKSLSHEVQKQMLAIFSRLHGLRNDKERIRYIRAGKFGRINTILCAYNTKLSILNMSNRL